MKRKLFGLLCVCMLLSGCGTGSSLPLQTESPTIQSPLPLVEQGIPLEGSSNLRYIPNEAVERMTAPEMRLLGNGLLLSAYEKDTLTLNHISLEDGSLIASASLPAASGTTLSIGSGEIGLCDRESGRVSILDERLRLLRTHEIPPEGDGWYLNSELDTLYIFSSHRGIQVRNLETDEAFWLVDQGFRVTPLGSGNGHVIFEYTDRESQKTTAQCLNLSTASLETLPVSSRPFSGIRQGETWLLQEEGSHVLVQGDDLRSFVWEGSGVRLLSPRRHLLAADPSGRNLTLFDTDGTFLSQCALPQSSNAVTGPDFVWSGYWEGYFFTDFLDSACRLMFWDVRSTASGENLQMSPPGQAQPVEPVAEPQLYEQAQALSQRFGVDIRIGAECTLDYSHYDSYLLTDPVFIRSALDILEQSLSQYPDGFFRQLPCGPIRSIRIELVGGIRLKDGITTHPDSVGGFTQDQGSYYTIVLDGFLLQPKILFHEFSHIIDRRLEWDALLREDALYSEERWLALQPEGFRYAMTYTDLPEEVLAYLDSGFFLSEYAMTFPSEDRAVLMASAMTQSRLDFEPGSGQRQKMQFYADCIRDCFDTEGWPEVTLWEQVFM